MLQRRCIKHPVLFKQGVASQKKYYLLTRSFFQQNLCLSFGDYNSPFSAVFSSQSRCKPSSRLVYQLNLTYANMVWHSSNLIWRQNSLKSMPLVVVKFSPLSISAFTSFGTAASWLVILMDLSQYEIRR